jgi:tetratricopeptide (TPR) repeat protein
MMVTEHSELQTLLQQGIEAVKRRDFVRGRDLLLQVVEQDDQIEPAWLWLSEAVEDPQDKVTALENVLALNPSNTEAGARLAQLQQTMTAAAPASAAAPDWEALLPRVPLEADDGIDDPYQCIYCGKRTRPEDNACPHCRHKLVWRLRSSQDSDFLRVAMLLMGITAGIGLLETAGPLLRVSAGAGPTAEFEFLFRFPGVEAFFGNFVQLTSASAQMLMFAFFGRLAALLLLLVGLRLRWTIFYYASIVAMLADLGWTLYLFVSSSLGLLGCAVNGLFAIAILGFLFASDREFSVTERRLYTGADTAARSALDFYKRGHDYRKLGMWALAVAQWRKAVGLAPKQTRYYKDLGIGYAQIKRFDRSLRVLEEAQRQAPEDKTISEIVALVQKSAAKDAAKR